MKFVVESAGGVASRVCIGAREFVFDQPVSVKGGGDRGPSPLDVLVVSVAACAHYYASAYLFGRSISTVGVAIDVEADKESVPAPRIGKLAMKVRVPEGLPEKHLIGIVRAIKRCPAYNTLLSAPAVELSVEIVRDPAASSAAATAQNASA